MLEDSDPPLHFTSKTTKGCRRYYRDSSLFQHPPPSVQTKEYALNDIATLTLILEDVVPLAQKEQLILMTQPGASVALASSCNFSGRISRRNVMNLPDMKLPLALKSKVLIDKGKTVCPR